MGIAKLLRTWNIWRDDLLPARPIRPGPVSSCLLIFLQLFTTDRREYWPDWTSRGVWLFHKADLQGYRIQRFRAARMERRGRVTRQLVECSMLNAYSFAPLSSRSWVLSIVSSSLDRYSRRDRSRADVHSDSGPMSTCPNWSWVPRSDVRTDRSLTCSGRRSPGTSSSEVAVGPASVSTAAWTSQRSDNCRNCGSELHHSASSVIARPGSPRSSS